MDATAFGLGSGVALTIRGRIRLLQTVIAIAVAAVAAIAVVDLQASIYYLERSQLARQQLAAASQLAVDANRYSEQIAELLLIGEPERPDFVSARSQLTDALRQLRQVTLREAAFVRSEEERTEEGVELERIDRMGMLFLEIDRSVERLLDLERRGGRAAAIALFRSEIENRLDAEFAEVINEGLEDEREEVGRIDADLVGLTTTMTVATLAAAAALILLVLFSGVLFSRSIARPITALTDGALAIERGDFEHRIAPQGNDEHAILSRRFNAMAEQLGLQRAMILDAQGALERQVAERTEQLADANRQLIATDQQRVRLLTDISHELRTPLTALRGEAEIALRGASKPEAAYRETLATMIARADELSRLVEDLLFLARSESDEIRFDFQRVDLTDLVSRAVQEAGVLGRTAKFTSNSLPAANCRCAAIPGACSNCF